MNEEYEQQQFWEDKPIEVILGDNSGWELNLNTQISAHMLKDAEALKYWKYTNRDLKRLGIIKTYTDGKSNTLD